MLHSPLKANADNAGTIFSSSSFEIPRYQRQYAWGKSELEDFWRDLKENLDSGAQYFMGLIILTEGNQRKHIVDGQQRLITLSLLASCLHHTAVRINRSALADRVSSTFLYLVDYRTDASVEKIVLSDPISNKTFQKLLDLRGSHSLRSERPGPSTIKGSSSDRLVYAYNFLSERLEDDIQYDTFQRLGAWAEFITHKLYFAVFMHDDPATAYQVFEVINTRGRDLTTADLLKNFVLSRAEDEGLDNAYERWEAISVNFPADGSNNLVQYIRHVITSYYGHVLPRELYTFLIGRRPDDKLPAPSASMLMQLLEKNLEPYLQMVDPSLSGLASDRQLRIFSALNQLNVIALRPVLLSGLDSDDPDSVAEFVLRLAVRRMVVGNLGTGNVERRFGDAARQLRETRSSAKLLKQLGDLNPKQDEFIERVKVRVLNKGLLSFLRRSAFQRETVPVQEHVLQWIWQPSDGRWTEISNDVDTSWAFSVGNSVLVDLNKRPIVEEWQDWKDEVLTHVVSDKERDFLARRPRWNAESAAKLGDLVANHLANVWY